MKSKSFILVTLMVLLSMLVTSCAAPTPQVIETEKVVKETVEVQVTSVVKRGRQGDRRRREGRDRRP